MLTVKHGGSFNTERVSEQTSKQDTIVIKRKIEMNIL